MGSSTVRLFVAGATLPVLLTACLAHTPAPVAERSLVDGPTPGVYVVRRYDTLYSVAWRYELDAAELARRNGIEPPYVIRTGQRIALTGTARPPDPPESAVPAPRAQGPDKPASADRPADTGASAPDAKPQATSKPTPAVKPVAVPKPPSPAVVPTPTTKPEPKRSAQPPSPGAPAKPAVAEPARRPDSGPPTTEPSAWRRPVTAQPSRAFGGGSKGWDYSLPSGTLIKAASPGVVVYGGPGLGGFRHLVIVKAREGLLVAYGVNVRPSLEEGDSVGVGDTVARAGPGASGGDFHFEVRNRGKPVDPSAFVGK